MKNALAITFLLVIVAFTHTATASDRNLSYSGTDSLSFSSYKTDGFELGFTIDARFVFATLMGEPIRRFETNFKLEKIRSIEPIAVKGKYLTVSEGPKRLELFYRKNQLSQYDPEIAEAFSKIRLIGYTAEVIFRKSSSDQDVHRFRMQEASSPQGQWGKDVAASPGWGKFFVDRDANMAWYAFDRYLSTGFTCIVKLSNLKFSGLSAFRRSIEKMLKKKLVQQEPREAEPNPPVAKKREDRPVPKETVAQQPKPPSPAPAPAKGQQQGRKENKWDYYWKSGYMAIYPIDDDNEIRDGSTGTSYESTEHYPKYWRRFVMDGKEVYFVYKWMGGTEYETHCLDGYGNCVPGVFYHDPDPKSRIKVFGCKH